MIAYFSGTGNTEWVAQRLSTLVCDSRLVRIPETGEISFSEEETLGICFPVHAWGIPRVVQEFIARIPTHRAIPYIYMVCTCGDDIGHTAREFQALLAERGQKVAMYYSVSMPNTYVNLPRFDVDSIDVQRQKVHHAEVQLQEAALCITERRQACCITPGAAAWFKSHVIRPLFLNYLVSDRYFHVQDSCVHCGRCAHVCPVENIHLDEDGTPVWAGTGACLTCMACYHSCPKHAILFGRYTREKGQYLFRKLKL